MPEKCNCLELALKQIAERLEAEPGSVEFRDVNLMTGLPVHAVEYKKPGGKKVHRTWLVPSFCPMCGKEYVPRSPQEREGK